MFPPSDNSYCGRHERNRIYDEGITDGKKWCRFFFRGCDTELTMAELEAKEVSCRICRAKLTKKQYSCDHSGCSFKVKERGFCKKHERDKYRKEEKEKGIKYCDIARGCFTLCTDGRKSCDTCLQKTRVVESARYNKRKELSQVLQTTVHTKGRVCSQCGKDFEAFQTRYAKESINCKPCQEIQAKQDETRKDRVRNYKEENCKNIKKYYRDYIISATKRGHEINLDFDTFSKLVLAECHYCGHKTDNEVNGIDRVDNIKGYSAENCVTACWKCNRIKHIYHKDFFIEKCKIIAKKSMPNLSFFKKWKEYYDSSQHKQFSSYIKDAGKRGLIVNITQEEWTHITRSCCYICGYQSAKGIGIDRVNNTIRSYTISNSRACCTSCNTMKGEIELEELIQHCSIVANRIGTQEIVEEEHVPAVERKHWKALGLYYAIISDTAADFVDSYSSVYSSEDFTELSRLIKESTKEAAINTLKTLLQTLKKRKHRAK